MYPLGRTHFQNGILNGKNMEPISSGGGGEKSKHLSIRQGWTTSANNLGFIQPWIPQEEAFELMQHTVGLQDEGLKTRFPPQSVMVQ